MDKLELEVLPICCVCKKIRIKDNPGWFSESEDPETYNFFIEKYKDKLSHTYCPEDFKELVNYIESIK